MYVPVYVPDGWFAPTCRVPPISSAKAPVPSVVFKDGVLVDVKVSMVILFPPLVTVPFEYVIVSVVDGAAVIENSAAAGVP